MTHPNPEMLTLAREARGWTQSDLAREAQISQAQISKLENGVLPLADEQLARVSAALRFPASFFSQEDRIYPFGSSCIYHRKKQSIGVGEYRTLLARMNVLRIRIERLLRGVELKAPREIVRMDIAAYDSPSSVARLLRGAWQIAPGPISDVTAAIESAGGIVVKCDFATRKLDAFSQWVPGSPPIFFVNSIIPTDRARYTLAHELGHVVMHFVPTARLEAEADEFAAEFLMPRKDFAPHVMPILTLGRLANMKPYWKTSMAAMARRARDVGRISDSKYRFLFTQLSKAGYRLQEPLELPEETPTTLRSIMHLHRTTHGYSLAQLSEITNTLPDEFLASFVPEESTPIRLVK